MTTSPPDELTNGPEDKGPERTFTIKQMRMIVVAVFVLMPIIGFVSALAGQNLVDDSPAPQPSPTVAATTSDTEHDAWREYRTKPSYVGTLEGLADREDWAEIGRVYYLPSNLYLHQSGNHEWFVYDWNLHAPIFKSAADAGNYPYAIRLVSGARVSTPEYHVSLEVTLPSRPDFGHTYYGPDDYRWEKELSRPNEDPRDPDGSVHSVLPIASVLPAKGHRLEEYYPDARTISQLPRGSSGYLFAGFVKRVGSSYTAYLTDDTYDTSAPQPVSKGPWRSGYVKVTRTAKGLMVCRQTLPKYERIEPFQIRTVPGDYRPQQTEVKAELSKTC